MKHLASLALASIMMLQVATAGSRPTKSARKKAWSHTIPPATTTAAPPIPPPPPGDAPADGAEPVTSEDRRESPTPSVRPPRPAAVVATNEAPPPPAETKEASSSAPPPAPASSADLEKLRADYDRLRDDLFRARSRAQIVEDALWKSKLSATFRWKGAPASVVHHATVKLDGGEIWDSGDKAITDDLVTVAERAVKPGPHTVTVRLEIRPGKKSNDSARLGYTSEHTFAIIVPDGKHTKMAITGDEDGDAPEYEPEIEVELESKK